MYPAPYFLIQLDDSGNIGVVFSAPREHTDAVYDGPLGVGSPAQTHVDRHDFEDELGPGVSLLAWPSRRLVSLLAAGPGILAVKDAPAWQLERKAPLPRVLHVLPVLSRAGAPAPMPSPRRWALLCSRWCRPVVLCQLGVFETDPPFGSWNIGQMLTISRVPFAIIMARGTTTSCSMYGVTQEVSSSKTLFAETLE